MKKVVQEIAIPVAIVAAIFWLGIKYAPRHAPPPTVEVVMDIGLMSDGTVRVGEQLYAYDPQKSIWVKK